MKPYVRPAERSWKPPFWSFVWYPRVIVEFFHSESRDWLYTLHRRVPSTEIDFPKRTDSRDWNLSVTRYAAQPIRRVGGYIGKSRVNLNVTIAIQRQRPIAAEKRRLRARFERRNLGKNHRAIDGTQTKFRVCLSAVYRRSIYRFQSLKCLNVKRSIDLRRRRTHESKKWWLYLFISIRTDSLAVVDFRG